MAFFHQPWITRTRGEETVSVNLTPLSVLPRSALRAVTVTTKSKSPHDFKPLLHPTPSASPQTPNRAQILGTQ